VKKHPHIAPRRWKAKQSRPNEDIIIIINTWTNTEKSTGTDTGDCFYLPND